MGFRQKYVPGMKLQWRHNGRDGVSNHQPHDCLPNRLSGRVYSGADQRKYQSSSSLAFVRGIHRGAVNSPHKWPVTWKMFPFGDVIMCIMLGENSLSAFRSTATYGLKLSLEYKKYKNERCVDYAE